MDQVRAVGTPFERGAQIGQALAPAIEASVDFNQGYLERHGLHREDLPVLLSPYLTASTALLPNLVEQVRGMAEGAGLPFLDLFFANAFEEVYGIVELGTPASRPLERCTDVALRSSTDTLLGHNEQWYAGDAGSVAVVLDVPDDGPAVLAPIVAGTLPLVGLNEFGGAFGTMSLSANDERVGVPRALVARHLLEARDPEDALERAALAGRAGGYSYLCTFPGHDPLVVETTATTAAGWFGTTHTNHALDPEVAAVACAPTEGSLSRLGRARELVESATPSVDGMLQLLSDHADSGQQICVHPGKDDGDEGSTILFAMVCSSNARSMWLTPGHPCTTEVERFDLT